MSLATKTSATTTSSVLTPWASWGKCSPLVAHVAFRDAFLCNVVISVFKNTKNICGKLPQSRIKRNKIKKSRSGVLLSFLHKASGNILKNNLLRKGQGYFLKHQVPSYNGTHPWVWAASKFNPLNSLMWKMKTEHSCFHVHLHGYHFHAEDGTTSF